MIKVPATLKAIGYVRSGMKLTFYTDTVIDVAQHFQKLGHLLFKENEIAMEEIPEEEADDGEKRPSRRLRAVLFVRWKQAQVGGKVNGDFETYYRAQVESMITIIKSKLDKEG